MAESLIEPSETLEELLAQVTEENVHEEVDTGPPVGREIEFDQFGTSEPM